MSKNPFPGPAPLAKDDGIFGRDREITEVIDRLIANRAVLVYSPAGAGRTSLIEAGLKPRLAAGNIECHSLSPSDASLELPGLEREQVLIFDRFEDVLTSGPRDADGEKKRRDIFWRFGQLLRKNRKIMAIFSLREDFAGPLDHYLNWFPELISSRVRLGLLTTANARKAIEGPLIAAGYTVDESATNYLLEKLARGESWGDRQDDWVEPPLLQVVCSRLGEALPGAGTAITAEFLSSLEEQKRIFDPEIALEDYYSQAVREAAEKSGTAERVIRAWFDNPRSSRLLQVAAEHLQEKRLIEPGPLATISAVFIEPIRNSNRASKDVLQRDAEVWHAAPSTDRLLRGERLREAERWAHTHQSALLDFEGDYLRESKSALRRRTLMRAVAVACVIASLAVAVISVRARAASNAFLVEQLAQETTQEVPVQPDSAALLALQAELESKGNMLENLLAPDIRAQATAAVNEAFLAVTMHDPFYVHAFQQPEPAAGCVWFDNQNLYTAAGNSDIRVVNQTTRTIAKILDANVHAPQRCGDGLVSRKLRIDLPDGWTYSDSGDTIQLTDSMGKVHTTAVPRTAFRVAVNPSHDRIAWTIAEQNYVYVAWLDSPSIPKESLSSGDFEPFCIRFSPDGKTLAEGGRDNNVRLWTLAGEWDQNPKWDAKILQAHNNTVLDLEFDASGREIFSSGADGRLVEWRMSEFKAPGDFISFLPDQVTARIPRTGQLSNSLTISSHGEKPQTIENTEMGFGEVAVSRAGMAVVAFANNRVGAVNFNLKPPKRSLPANQTVSAIAISANGVWAAGARNNRSLRKSEIFRWKVGDLLAAPESGDVPVAATIQLPPGVYIDSLALSEDGSILASGAENNRIQFWDVKGTAMGVPIPTQATPLSLTFGPKLLASIDEGGNLQLWDLNSRRQAGATMPLRPSDGNPMMPIAFTQNGDALDIMTANGIVKIPIQSAGFHDAVSKLVPPGFNSASLGGLLRNPQP